MNEALKYQKPEKSGYGVGIQGKIVLLVSLLVLITSITITFWIFSKFNDELMRNKLGQLSTESKLQGLNFKKEIEELMSDVQFLKGTPPIQGIIRAESNNGIDPFDGSTSQIWHSRLATIFSEMLKAKSRYTQIRYIGLANSGLEIVRVDRQGLNDSIRIVSGDRLQTKGHRDYVKNTITLGDNEVYLSNIELNREQEKIVEPFRSVLRAAVPVYSEDGVPFGILIINYDMPKLFLELREAVDKHHTYFFTNQNGDYLLHPDKTKEFGFEFGLNFNAKNDFKSFQNVLDETIDSEFSTIRKDKVLNMITIHFNPYSPLQKIGIIVEDDYEDVTAISTRVLQETSYLIVALILVSLFLGIWLARKLSAPILQITESVRAYVRGEEDIKLPANLTGEAGVLARAFKESFDEITIKNEKLIQSNSDLEQFAYIASHDLQEPLRTVTSYTQLMEKRYGETFDENARTYMEFIVNSAKRMHTLILDVLAFSRINTQTDFEQTVDLNIMMKQIEDDLRETIKETKAKIIADELPTIKSNGTLLRQLFQNIIANGIKYRAPERAPEIRVSFKENDRDWQFSIQDNGIGIKDKYHEKIFLVFQRLHGHEKYSGNGIGLALCKKIINNHGGKIWLESVSGEGTTFFFSIPKKYQSIFR